MGISVRRVVKKLAAVLVGAYVLVCGALYTLQRQMVFPRPGPAGLTGRLGTLVEIGGEFPTVALHLPGTPTVVRFHGNGSQLATEEWLALECKQRGLGYFAVEYPGYPRAPGEPSQQAILSSALAAVGWLEKRGVAKDQMILFGQSLGTGPAVFLAARGWGRKLVLATPYTSIGDIGARAFPWLPVRLLIRDPFPAGQWAEGVKQPTLVFHGTSDSVIPFDIGAGLAKKISGAELIVLEGVDHNDIWDQPGMLDRALDFAR
jgi:uncharacterized protein